ncbi:response regulator transcription factor [Nonomuraea sp. NBC_01738]|uniref:response regulator transcription factor n=1 Tax=Nonomuraea sp. NBC_01738 TaxID=2976003 RepID=UPI002E140C72|nr:response regulator transcription factor [Nonomuraea sp. NBC_01738]
MARILLVEDDPSLRRGLSMGLRRQGHQLHEAGTGEEALDLLRAAVPEIVVLDLMLPGIDGFEVARRIRSAGSTPIIMLTARDDDLDIVSGLEAGADDYVVKPIRPRVLDARIRAILRRAERVASGAEIYGDLAIDRDALTVTRAGQEVVLTPTELRMLLELSRSPGVVMSRQHLLQAVWEHDFLGDSRIVDACVQRLRAKIEPNPAQPVHVRTVRTFGYRFQADPR